MLAMPILNTKNLVSLMFSLLVVLALSYFVNSLKQNSYSVPISTAVEVSSFLDYADAATGVVLSSTNQAMLFNHVKQHAEFYLVLLLCLFIGSLCFYYFEQTVVRAPPWFYRLRCSCKSKLSGWRESNLLYKAQLRYQS